MSGPDQPFPTFPGIVFIVAPIIGITGLVCWATIQNRRGFGVMRQFIQQEDEAAAKALAAREVPQIYDIWIQKDTTEGHGERRRSQTDTRGRFGDNKSLSVLVERPLALLGMSPELNSSSGAANLAGFQVLATLVRMPTNIPMMQVSKLGNGINASEVEILVGTCPTRAANT
ncbi:hypothetical protein M408DRAFT_327277 [Serendipita vermifera MAFF 305830]|uniref:Uncharacterized protein n=1 Tax=Serendipita vermifera MAFF 305830 TaxID=933852 RepID=A0A0C3BK55_SERVB|nr:hypothetical protein M408DRAFT_327277 [Serendipita vermifera MAFF 305830]